MNNLVKVSDIFNVGCGVSLDLVNLTQCKSTDKNAVPFVSRTGKNNGISAYVEMLSNIKPNPTHTLSVACGGSVLSTFYHPFPYYSGNCVYVLIPKRKMTIVEMLFYAKCIYVNKYKYNYGRPAYKTLKNILIPPQIPEELKITLEIYYKELKTTIFQKSLIITDKKIKLDIDKWKKFEIIDLFKIQGSKTISLLELAEYGKGKYPYITAKTTNNGVEGFYNFYLEKGEILVFEGAFLGYCTYQAFSFTGSSDIKKLTPKFKMNKYIAMFLVIILNLEQYRYNYSRKCNLGRMKKTSIKLPSKNGNPDFRYMENYIKSLSYSLSL